MAERVASAAKIASPVRARQRRRCMRCVDNGAPSSVAVDCLGAKGRFGRDACEYFDAKGVSLKEYFLNRRDDSDNKMTQRSKVVTNIIAGNEQVEVTLAPSSPSHTSYHLDASMMPSPKPTVWKSPTRNSPVTKRQKLDAGE